MKILFFGDIMGRPGREALEEIMPKWQKQYQPDLIIANAENLAHGKGVSEKALDQVLTAGVSVLTSGNHILGSCASRELLADKSYPLLRPLNYSEKEEIGRGEIVLTSGAYQVLVANFIGQVFMKRPYANPFLRAQKLLQDYEDIKIKIIDFHAEASSEKKAFGFFLDGRVSAVLGTHTHIPTSDAQILAKGTAYISDVGMVGVKDSVLGMDKQAVLKEFLAQIPQKPDMAQGAAIVNAVLLEIDPATGKSKNIKQLIG